SPIASSVSRTAACWPPGPPATPRSTAAAARAACPGRSGDFSLERRHRLVRPPRRQRHGAPAAGRVRRAGLSAGGVRLREEEQEGGARAAARPGLPDRDGEDGEEALLRRARPAAGAPAARSARRSRAAAEDPDRDRRQLLQGARLDQLRRGAEFLPDVPDVLPEPS